MRRFFYWYLPLFAALIAASIFGYGLVSWLRGDTGTIVDIAPRPVQSSAPRSKIVPLILGDSLPEPDVLVLSPRLVPSFA